MTIWYNPVLIIIRDLHSSWTSVEVSILSVSGSTFVGIPILRQLGSQLGGINWPVWSKPFWWKVLLLGLRESFGWIFSSNNFIVMYPNHPLLLLTPQYQHTPLLPIWLYQICSHSSECPHPNIRVGNTQSLYKYHCNLFFC